MTIPFGCSAAEGQFIYELAYHNNNNTSFNLNIYDTKGDLLKPVKNNVCINSNDFSYSACSIVGNHLYIIGKDKSKRIVAYEYGIIPVATSTCQQVQLFPLPETKIISPISITPQFPSIDGSNAFILVGSDSQEQVIAELYNNANKTSIITTYAASSDFLPISITHNNNRLALFQKSAVYLYELNSDSVNGISKNNNNNNNNSKIPSAPKVDADASFYHDGTYSKRQMEPLPVNTSNDTTIVYQMTNSLLFAPNTKINASPVQVDSQILLPINGNNIVKINLITINSPSGSKAEISTIDVDTINTNIQNPSINAITYDNSHTVYLSNLDSANDIKLFAVDQSNILSGIGGGGGGGGNNFPVAGAIESNASLSTGAIIGIVIGSVVGLILIGLILFFIWRNKKKKQQRQQKQLQQINNQLDDSDIAMAEKIPPSYPYRSIPKNDTNNNNSNNKWLKHALSSGIIKSINNSSSPQNDDQYRPNTTNEILMIGSDTYGLNSEPPVYNIFPQGYATRSAGEYTIHYFKQNHVLLFLRLVEVSRFLWNQSKQQPNNDHHSSAIETKDAIVLTNPVDHGYQYLWITSKFSFQHTLHYFLFNELNPTVDRTQFSFKVWSTLSLLNSLKGMHSYGWIHCKLNTYSYYFEQPSTITDWSLCGFYQSQPISISKSSKSSPTSSSNSSPTTTSSLSPSLFISSKNTVLELDEYSPPELIKQLQPNTTSLKFNPKMAFTPSIDVWSLGCILYSLATGKYAFQHIQEYQMLLSTNQLQSKIDAMLNEVAFVDESYKTILSRMLQIDPSKRDHLTSLIAYWVDVHNLNEDDDDDDEIDED